MSFQSDMADGIQKIWQAYDIASWHHSQAEGPYVESAETGLVSEKFAVFEGMPEPTDFDPHIANLEAAAAKMAFTGFQDPISGDSSTSNPELDDIDTVAMNLEDWTGNAASACINNFINPFDHYCQQLFNVACVITNAYRAEREIWVRAQDDILKIQAQTVTALNSTHETNGEDFTGMVCSLVGAVIGVAGAVPSGGLTLALAGVAAASSVAPGVLKEITPDSKPEPYDINGDSPQEVINQMATALGKVKEAIRQEEQRIKDQVLDGYYKVQGDKDQCVPPRPALADVDAGNVTKIDGLGDAT